jgi:hypothetical protein
MRGRGRLRIKWEDHMQKLARGKRKILQEAFRLAKDKKAFWNWLMKLDA